MTLDRRVHAFRDDLADERLFGKVDAAAFVRGEPARVTAAFADIKRYPRDDAPLDSQILHGETLLVFERNDGWAWVQSDPDRYVGYVEEKWLGPIGPVPTHRVRVPRTFLYPAPDMKLPRSAHRAMGSLVTVTGHAETRATHYALLPDGSAAIADHLVALGERAPDYVAVAENLVMTPYLWGGSTAFGLDCSGLVQLSMTMAGRHVARDSDMQASTLGTEVALDDVERGDLVFWHGHVAIVTGPDTIIHANGRTMTVAVEKLSETVARVAMLYGLPTICRRP